MSTQFIKMHGLGNDFMVVDASQQRVNLPLERIRALADRKIGIGFDQLLVIEPSTDQTHDFFYKIFNANGQEVEQCGNGARCVALYIFKQGLTQKKQIILKTLSGNIECRLANDEQVIVNMGRPTLKPEKIPLLKEQALRYTLSLDKDEITFGAVSLGNPHAVIKVDNVLKAPVEKIGRLLQGHPVFPNQVNVGFMEIVSPSLIRLRVYERGVGETRSCGSGACAAVVVGRLWHQLDKSVFVELPGGRMEVEWGAEQGEVFMTGPAVMVYKGLLLD